MDASCQYILWWVVVETAADIVVAALGEWLVLVIAAAVRELEELKSKLLCELDKLLM